MRYKLLIFVGILSLLAGCKNSNTSVDPRVLAFDIPEETKDIENSELIKEYLLIPLETSDSVLITRIDKAIWNKHKLYVADFESNFGCLFVFDEKGKLIYKISRKGRAPDEYLQPFDFFIDEATSTLNLLSRLDKKLLQFDAGSGTLKNIISLPAWFSKIVPYKDGFIGVTNNCPLNDEIECNIGFMNSLGELTGTACPIESSWRYKLSNQGPSLFTYKQEIWFNADFPGTTLTCVSNPKSAPVFLDFKTKQLPKAFHPYPEYHMKCYDPAYIPSIDFFQETDRFYIAGMPFQGQSRICLFDKHTQISEVYSPEVITSRYFHGIGKIVTLTENYMVTSIPAMDIQEGQAGKNKYNNWEEEYPEQIQRMRKELPQASEEDNPFVAIYFFNN